MTPEQILTELDLLKDLTNDHGKGVINALKSELKLYFEQGPSVIEKDDKMVEVPVEKSGDRREEPRDPMEHEQHLAEDLGLV